LVTVLSWSLFGYVMDMPVKEDYEIYVYMCCFQLSGPLQC
jgi:hypothetical protein